MRKSIIKTLKSKKILFKKSHKADTRKNYSSTKATAVALILTPLVDAFAILVIYLLVNTTQSTNNLELYQKINLPTAHQTNNINQGITLVIKDGQYHINNKIIAKNNLTRALSESLTQTDLKMILIEADENIGFNLINPIMIASSEVGINKIQFAVIKGIQL